ncbi:MAG: hypothetical protein NUV68_01115 [Caldiserica bacterium]|nr:hypothetical protein [Caldisericota bacterium]
MILLLFSGFAALGGFLVLGPMMERFLKGKAQEMPPFPRSSHVQGTGWEQFTFGESSTVDFPGI